jgi:hypothetical protein
MRKAFEFWELVVLSHSLTSCQIFEPDFITYVMNLSVYWVLGEIGAS